MDITKNRANRVAKKITPAAITVVQGIVVVFVFLCVGVPAAHAATLFLSPSHLELKPGQTGTVSVYVDTDGASVNAVSAQIRVQGDAVGVSAVSKNGSIVSFWAQEPSYTANGKQVQMEGIVLNPGFAGARGKVATITLKAKAVGDTDLIFESASVLANDGQGTNILSESKKANVTVVHAPVETETPNQEPTAPEPSPFVVSSTLPEVTVQKLNPAPPRIINFPSLISATDPLTLTLQAVPQARVVVSLTRDGESVVQNTVTDVSGFAIVQYAQGISAGYWNASAQVIDEEKGTSQPSLPVSIVVVGPLVQTLTTLRVLIPGLITIALILLAAIAYALSVFKFLRLHKKVAGELSKTRQKIHADIKELEDELNQLQQKARSPGGRGQSGPATQKIKKLTRDIERLIDDES